MGLLLALAMSLSLCACSLKPEEVEVIDLDIKQIRNICELSTLECYYHNVAKSVKSAGTGVTHWLERDRKFWIEYTGKAIVGIDMAAVNMTVEGTDVTVTYQRRKAPAFRRGDISRNQRILLNISLEYGTIVL